MMNPVNIKSSPFEIINMLFSGHFTKEEITDQLDISSVCFYKSIHKIREAGFDVKSTNIVYHIEDYNTRLKLNAYDRSVLAYMLALACIILPSYKMQSFKKLIRKLTFFTNSRDYREIVTKFHIFKRIALTLQYKDKVRKLRECIFQKTKIKATLRSGRIINIEPKKFDWKGERVYICFTSLDEQKERKRKNTSKKRKNIVVIDGKKLERMRIDRIAKISNQDESEYIPNKQEVIFELSGKLAESYLLKADERVIDNTKTTLVIASGTKDKQALFKRLLRYDTLCKVLFPKEDVNIFTGMITQAIKNLQTNNAIENKE